MNIGFVGAIVGSFFGIAGGLIGTFFSIKNAERAIERVS